MNTYTVAHPDLSPPGRILVISDIHGNLVYLKGLLDKLALRRSDHLVLLGDIVEKGPENLATLRYILSLRECCDLHTVLGNCDFWHIWVDGCDAAWDERTLSHLLRQKHSGRRGLILEMCREIGHNLTETSELPTLKASLREAFAAEFDLLRAMPFALETENYTFVHGGIPAGQTLESAGPWKCMKVDRFADTHPRMDKWTVVGHTPVCLYGKDILSAAPIIDREARLISIDGGCVLKDDGQLNALVIENGEFSTEWYDPFPVAEALDAQEESERSYYIRWGDNAVTLLHRGGAFSRVRHERTGYEMDVPTDFLYEREGRLFVTDATDYRPAVMPGDTVSVVRETERGVWIKKNGVTGWYGGALHYV